MRKKLHILFLCGWYPSNVFPNNGDFIERHAISVARMHKVTVFHMVSNPKSEKNIEIITEQNNGVTSHIAYVRAARNPVTKIYLFLVAFHRLLQKESQFDLVHLNQIYPYGFFSLYLKWCKGIPFVITDHWTGYLTTAKFPVLKRKMIRRILKNAAHFCPVTLNLGKTIMTKFKIQIPYTIVPNVVNTDRFFPTFQKPEIYTLLHISSMKEAHKNISGILKTVADYSKKDENFRLILLGEASDSYRKEAENLGISDKIEFINHVPHEEVPKLINKASVFLLFSHFENLPCVILESFSCGIPVISTDVGGINEFFPKDFGRLIDVNNSQQLLKAIEDFKTMDFSEAKKREMHDFVKNTCSEEQICRCFDEVYHKVLKNNT